MATERELKKAMMKMKMMVGRSLLDVHNQIRDFDQAMSVSDDLVYSLYENGMEEIVQNMFQVTCTLEVAKLKTKLIQTDLTQYFSTAD